MIVWKIHIDEEGRTTPVLDLLTKVPEQGNVIHSRDFLSRTPVPFFAQHTSLSLDKKEIHLCRAQPGKQSPV